MTVQMTQLLSQFANLRFFFSLSTVSPFLDLHSCLALKKNHRINPIMPWTLFLIKDNGTEERIIIFIPSRIKDRCIEQTITIFIPSHIIPIKDKGTEQTIIRVISSIINPIKDKGNRIQALNKQSSELFHQQKSCPIMAGLPITDKIRPRDKIVDD